ncbi:MAG: alkyl hydroperoxide reductase [Phycisphaerales bacterium]
MNPPDADPDQRAQTTAHPNARPWMRHILYAAAIYNIAWGAFVILFPNALFNWIGAEPPRYPELWQCIGMIVGVYSIGYAVAAPNPTRHWPIVLVGLLGKVLGPIGFIDAVFIKNTFPIEFGATILTNDLIWWIPFALILRAAWLEHHPPTTPAKPATTHTTDRRP